MLDSIPETLGSHSEPKADRYSTAEQPRSPITCFVFISFLFYYITLNYRPLLRLHERYDPTFHLPSLTNRSDQMKREDNNQRVKDFHTSPLPFLNSLARIPQNPVHQYIPLLTIKLSSHLLCFNPFYPKIFFLVTSSLPLQGKSHY